ncbi:MAG: hypothetical protein NC078_01405 [Ruminococcus sp.]|nr:hypothetical protein [Ruminococcus sp.]
MNMKKLLCVLVLCMSAVTLAGCQKTGECESCGKKAPLYRVWLNMDGSHTEEIDCEDCANEMMSFLRELNELAGADSNKEGEGFGMEKLTG